MGESTQFDDAYAYLVGLYGENPNGLIWIGGQADGFKGSTFTGPLSAARYAIELDARGGQGVYHRSTTLASRPEKRGTAEDSAAVFYFALDFDVKGPGHKAEDLPENLDDLKALIEAAGFPSPSAIVNSGGGFYPQWRFAESIDVRDREQRVWAADAFALISEHFITVAGELGWKLDNVRDLARVFRMPGTTNRKTEPVAASWGGDLGDRFDLGVLASIANRRKPREVIDPATPTTADDLFDDAARVFTEEQAKDFIRRARAKLAGTTSGLNLAINNFAMACAHFPWLLTRGQCAAHVIKALGPSQGWTEPDDDDRATIKSAYEATEAGKSWIAVKREVAPDAVPEEPEDRYTDAQMAARLVRGALAGQAIYTTALGWLRYDGRRWATVPDEVMNEIARLWVLERYGAAVARYGEGLRDGSITHKIADDPNVQGWARAQGLTRLTAMVKLARGIVLHEASELDRHDQLLNTPSGVVDLRTGECGPHDPELMLSKITNAAYVPGAESLALKAALEAVPDDARDWLQRQLGEAATGISGERLVLLTGAGRNGKTLLMGSAFRALGTYAAKVPSTLLLRAKAQGGATPERMTLRGVRLAYMEETPEDGYLDATVVKDLLDAEEIEGRHLYRDITSWKPTHSLFLNTNHAPTMGDTGDGAWRRLTRVDFPYRFRRASDSIEGPMDRAGDPGLKQALGHTQDGQEALLAWIVAGAVARAWEGAEGADPASVVASLRLWREESDDLLRFISDEMDFDSNGVVVKTDMYGAYAAWLRANGHKVVSAKTFGTRMLGHSILSKRVGETQAVPSGMYLSRPAYLLTEGLLRPLGDRPRVYTGLVFKSSDQGE